MRARGWLVAAGVVVLAACSSGGDATPAAPSPTAVGSTPRTTPSARAFTLVATGDLLLHPKLWEQAEQDGRGGNDQDYAPMLADVRGTVSGADLGLCHLETPLAPAQGPYRGYPSFSAPPQIVQALKLTGYDACSTASNHTFDQGGAGVDRTLDTLDAAGILHTGSARTQAEQSRTTFVDAGGVKVALLSYAYGFNGAPYPGGNTWRANKIDVGAIEAAARTARARGAEVVVLSLHWGTEYQQRPSAQQLQLAPELARSPDVDVIVSHHAHVVEPLEKIGATWVVYGLGNLVSAHSTPDPANQEGLLVRFTFTERAAPTPGKHGRFLVTRVEYDPLLMTDRAPLRVLEVDRALASGDVGSSTKARLRTALTRTTKVVGSRGAVQDGLVPLS